FFQAEDGIRDYKVTGVQTCALPILQQSVQVNRHSKERSILRTPALASYLGGYLGRPEAGCTCPPLRKSRKFSTKSANPARDVKRSEERRVGKECRSRRWTEHVKKKE